MHPVKCWDFAKRRRFPVRFPRVTVIVPDFQRNNTQGGDYQIFERFRKKCILALTLLKGFVYLVLGRKILKSLILNDISSISQDEDLFDTVFRWPKSAKNGIFDEFPQNLRFFKISECH
jgi:hypothetical protein